MELSDSESLASQQPPTYASFPASSAPRWLVHGPRARLSCGFWGITRRSACLQRMCFAESHHPWQQCLHFSKKMLTLAFFSAVILLWESTKRSPLRQTQSLSSLPPWLSGSNYTTRLFSSASEISLLIPYPAPLWNVTFSHLSVKLPVPFQLLFPTTNMPSL